MSGRLELANAIRALSMDAVQKANSGHPGMPMGMADIAEVLWNDFLKHNPADPSWFDRDRFVVSNGHGSMLLYSLLHLSGYDLPIEELKKFRQLHSKTPGHPEYGMTPGVETTTGPLGQGLSNAVGMAIAEQALAKTFNREGYPLVDHWTYVFAGDGCLMEGISHEACSLAGTLALHKLVMFYDDNGISIDGEVHGWFRDDTPARFEGYGWQVIRNVNGHDADEVKQALATARKSIDKPTLICCKTIIGFGSPNKQGKESSHGAALGDDEIKLTRDAIKWPHAPFEVPREIYAGWNARERGARAQGEWTALLEKYAREFPELAAEFRRRVKGELPKDWKQVIDGFIAKAASNDKTMATRKSSKTVLDVIGPRLPELLGGSADLTESNLTKWDGAKVVHPGNVNGNYIFYGVREFGMSAVMNGIVLHGGLIPFGGTFLTFSDYARNALRMAALMKIGTIFVYTHDSIGLGEDGPTHQSVEHVSSLRLIPNLETWRPADLLETAIAWKEAIERRNGPTAMALSRQNTDIQKHDDSHAANIARGGYVLWEPASAPEAIIMATGSEVGLAVKAAQKAGENKRAVRVVSMPCVERFMKQPASYREQVLPAKLSRRLAIEAGITWYWRPLVGPQGDVLGVDTYGESAPAPAVFTHFGFTLENVLEKLAALLK
ncbi:MAG TPA: transketolase [Verrucomicrobiae bacterium]|nr:transketolase [Verrucomicrobiae bacterium]